MSSSESVSSSRTTLLLSSLGKMIRCWCDKKRSILKPTLLRCGFVRWDQGRTKGQGTFLQRKRERPASPDLASRRDAQDIPIRSGLPVHINLVESLGINSYLKAFPSHFWISQLTFKSDSPSQITFSQARPPSSSCQKIVPDQRQAWTSLMMTVHVLCT